MMDMHMIEQRSSEWFALRCGKATASRVADIVSRTKTGWGASRASYAAQLLAERMTGVVEDGHSSAAMQWGCHTEGEARDAYRLMADADVEEVGFVNHPTITMSGASPDGLVGDDGLIEIKCPNTSTHISSLLAAKIPTKYQVQIQWQLACTGRAWCDFVSYDPRLPDAMRLFVRRILRDDATIVELEEQVRSFLGEIDETIEAIRMLYDVDWVEGQRSAGLISG
jgi:putative phage-type endonuclease